jgi:hypothetical protein
VNREKVRLIVGGLGCGFFNAARDTVCGTSRPFYLSPWGIAVECHLVGLPTSDIVCHAIYRDVQGFVYRQSCDGDSTVSYGTLMHHYIRDTHTNTVGIEQCGTDDIDLKVRRPSLINGAGEQKDCEEDYSGVQSALTRVQG